MPKIKKQISRRRRRRSKLGSSMGNKITRTQVWASEYYLYDLPSSYNLVVMEVLVCGRFFKILCNHDEGLVLVKVNFKRDDPLVLKQFHMQFPRSIPDPKALYHWSIASELFPFRALKDRNVVGAIRNNSVVAQCLGLTWIYMFTDIQLLLGYALNLKKQQFL